MKKTFSSLIICFAVLNLYSQTDSLAPYPIVINSVILDNEVKLNSTVTHIKWLNDTIKVSFQNENIKLDTASHSKMRVALKDSTLMTTQEEIDFVILAIKTGAQNCYSYALEKYFEYNKAFSQDIFKKTSRIDRESVEKILNNYFKNIDEFSTTPRRNLKKSIPNNVLIAFINKSDWNTHLIYYHNDIFYTKNGAFKPTEFKSLKKFLKKHYCDTKKMIIYKIDEDKIKSTCANMK